MSEEMTREEAIAILKGRIDNPLENRYSKEAFKMAIASLETDEAYQLEYEKPEFCADCISRKNILGSLNGAFASTDWNKALFRKIVMDSPSVLPKADKHTGKWEHKQMDSFYHVIGQCSNCKARYRINNYCPNCGADMREVEG